MIGAGIGAGLSAYAFGWADKGTVLWNAFSNGLLTSNVNMLSSFVRGQDLNMVMESGQIGFTAGAIGGAIASSSKFNLAADRYSMNIQGIRTQNYVTNVLNGSFDRMVRSIDGDLAGKDIIKNTIFGGLEGLFSARMFSSDKFLGFGAGLNDFKNPVIGRYLSGFLSNSLTSNPGASSMIARIYGSVYPFWMLGKMNDDISTSISTGIMISPFIYIVLSALQAHIIPNYPYAYEFLKP